MYMFLMKLYWWCSIEDYSNKFSIIVVVDVGHIVELVRLVVVAPLGLVVGPTIVVAPQGISIGLDVFFVPWGLDIRYDLFFVLLRMLYMIFVVVVLLRMLESCFF